MKQDPTSDRKRNTAYEQTLERIHSYMRFGSKLGLERMNSLLERIGNPERQLPIIHVGGTNGKGSVCRYLATMLSAAGYRIGLYTSPYLEEFTERIEFDGQAISQDDLVECAGVVLRQAEAMAAAGEESPTEFELVTAIGFLYFSRQPVDFVLLEVGLGGRGDSTNIVKQPLATVISSISFDHMEVLGHSLTAIAAEKAGIIKSGCPLVARVDDAAAAAVIKQRAADLRAPYYDVNKAVISRLQPDLDGYAFDLELGPVFQEAGAIGPGRVHLGMLGRHQAENAACALTTIEILRRQGTVMIEWEQAVRAIRGARQKGRLEVLSRDPLILIDGAHNAAGMQALSQVVRDLFQGKRILCVTGMLKDKEVDHMLRSLYDMKVDLLVTEPDNPRRLLAEEIRQKIEADGQACQMAEHWFDAARSAIRKAPEYDIILFTGSLYLIGPIRQYLTAGRVDRTAR
jgi:dihydrofolate synthase/folylpolyglutamate synthase